MKNNALSRLAAALCCLLLFACNKQQDLAQWLGNEVMPNNATLILRGGGLTAPTMNALPF